MKYVLHPNFFPAILITLMALSAVRWGFEGSLKLAVYWAAAAVLNAAITFLPE